MEKELLLKELSKTRDKNLFIECADYLKKDFDFIVEVMKIFCDDFDFIEEIAESYCRYIPVETFESDPRFMELSILLGKFVPLKSPYYQHYKSRLDAIYSTFLLNIKMLKEHYLNVSELGFSLLVNEYGNRENIVDYFAVRMATELYTKNAQGTFEDMIHANFDDFWGIEEEGYLWFFIRNLTNIDAALGKYMAEKDELLDDLIDDLDYIGENWEIYQEDVTEQSVEMVREWIKEQAVAKAYGDEFDYEQVSQSVIISKGLGTIFEIEKSDLVGDNRKVKPFLEYAYKRDLGLFIDKVFAERQTLSGLERIRYEGIEENQKKLEKKDPHNGA